MFPSLLLYLSSLVAIFLIGELILIIFLLSIFSNLTFTNCTLFFSPVFKYLTTVFCPSQTKEFSCLNISYFSPALLQDILLHPPLSMSLTSIHLWPQYSPFHGPSPCHCSPYRLPSYSAQISNHHTAAAGWGWQTLFVTKQQSNLIKTLSISTQP